MPIQVLLDSVFLVVGLALLLLAIVTLREVRKAEVERSRRSKEQDERSDRLAASAQVHRDEIFNAQRDTLAQVEALIDLYSLVSPRNSMPSTQGWASSATTLQAVIRLILETSPDVVVECGSGSSTVWLGYALQRNGHGRCVSLEHLPEFAEATRTLVRLHGLEDVVEVRLAPLKELSIDAEPHLWYDPAAIADLEDIGVVFVDGPPGYIAPLARFPAMPVLIARCTPDATFLLDDTKRPEELRTVEEWLARLPCRQRGQSTSGTGWKAVQLDRATRSDQVLASADQWYATGTPEGAA
jgi:predicted O-methyltransferase YrrM